MTASITHHMKASTSVYRRLLDVGEGEYRRRMAARARRGGGGDNGCLGIIVIAVIVIIIASIG